MTDTTLTKLHESLWSLEGEWIGQGEVYPNPWGPSGATQCAWTFRVAHKGWHVIHDYREVRGGTFRFEAHGVLSVDPAAKEVVWFLFDDYGFPPMEPARGGWMQDRLELLKATPRGQSRTVLQLQDQVLVYTVEFRPPGEGAYAMIAQVRLTRA
jgi:hypothetical protein